MIKSEVSWPPLDKVMLVLVRIAVRAAPGMSPDICATGPLMDMVSVSVAAKLLTLPMLMEEPPVRKGLNRGMLSTLGLAVSEKSGVPTFTVMATLCEPEPVPVTVTVYMPGAVPPGTVTVSVEVPGAVTEVGLRLPVGPAGLTVAVRLTFPEKPEMLPTVMVDVPEPPGGMFSVVGLAEMVKSCGATMTGTVTV